MFSLSCHARYRIDALMNYPLGILVQKLMLTESESKGFLCVFSFVLRGVFCGVFKIFFVGILYFVFVGVFLVVFYCLFVCLVSFSHYSKAAGF